MQTIIISEGITVTMKSERVAAYYKALEATENRKAAYDCEDFDWQDLEDFWADEFEAWEKFYA